MQVYTFSTDTWKWSGAPGSILAPLPTARSGMGAGVFLNGNIYLMGGETSAATPPISRSSSPVTSKRSAAAASAPPSRSARFRSARSSGTVRSR